MKHTKTQKGVHKMEFYAALNEIKNLYFNQGYVVYKILYEKLKKKYSWGMTYNTFIVYAKREKMSLSNDDKLIIDSKQQKSLESTQETETPEKKRPVIVRTDEKDYFKTTNDIPDDRRL